MKSLSVLCAAAIVAGASFAAVAPAMAQNPPAPCKPAKLPPISTSRPAGPPSPEAVANLATSQAWLAQNAKQPGVKSLPSGAQYKVLTSGDKDAACANPDLRVRLHYEGRLTDGKVFDSSLDGAPAVFNLNSLIAGWQQVVPYMRIGDEWEIYLPPNLGYGERGSGADIPPNSVLIFKLKLLGMLG